MNKEEIIEGNELIVSFLGWTKFSHNQKYNLTNCRDYDCYDIGEFSKYSDIYIPECGDLPAAHYNLEFHSSWDWLMPVVEKIETIEQDGLYYNFQILGGCSVYIISSDMEEIINVDNGDSKLHNVWLVVIEFIKWYNTQNNE